MFTTHNINKFKLKPISQNNNPGETSTFQCLDLCWNVLIITSSSLRFTLDWLGTVTSQTVERLFEEQQVDYIFISSTYFYSHNIVDGPPTVTLVIVADALPERNLCINIIIMCVPYQ